MKKKVIPWLSVPFIAAIFLLGILSVGTEDIEKSEFENRTLQTFPIPTWDTIKTGEYFKTFETYFADQFFARNTWLTMYTKYEMQMNKTYVNGDYHVTSEDWILSKPVRVSDEGVQKTADRLNQFAEDIHALGKEVYYYGLPHKTQLVQHLYPSYVDFDVNDVENELLPKLTALDGTADLTAHFMENFTDAEREDMSFKTDHHWNVKAAYESFQQIMADLGRKSAYVTSPQVNDDAFHFYEVNPNHFLGSWNRNLYKQVPEDEVVPMIEPKDAEHYKYYWGRKGGDLEERTFRDIVGSKLGNDTLEYAGAYAFSLAHVKIENKNAPNKSHILIIKDSYVNPMQIMFASQFQTVEIVDNRYTEGVSAMELVAQSDADMVAFMFNNTNISGSSFIFYGDEAVENGDYYVNADGWILSKPRHSSDAAVQKAADRLNQFASDVHGTGKEVYYYTVPHKLQLVRHLYPSYVKYKGNDLDQELFPKLTALDGAVDLTPYFMEHFTDEEREGLAFKTDHHWNATAAYRAFVYIMKDLDGKSAHVSAAQTADHAFNFYEINPEHFLGSWNENLEEPVPEDEVIPLIEPKDAEGYRYYLSREGGDLEEKSFREIVGTRLKESSIDYPGAYTYSLAHVKIENENAPNKSHILIIKDSYANPMQVMFASQFQTVEILDNRYLEGVTAMELVEQSGADLVAVLLNATNLSGRNFIFYGEQ